MDHVFDVAAKISTMWSLAAFAIAAIVYLGVRKARDASPLWWIVIVAITLLGLLPIAGWLYVRASKNRLDATQAAMQAETQAIYRIRVTVVGPENVPVDGAHVWSSVGGEPKKVEGGWQFDVPSAAKPADGSVTIWAKIENTALHGDTSVRLGKDHSPTCRIDLQRDETATIRGIVTDGDGHALDGVRTSIVGYGPESVTTKSDGGFTLPAHVASGQVAQIHAEKDGYLPVTQDHPAGGLPATIMLEKRRR